MNILIGMANGLSIWMAMWWPYIAIAVGIVGGFVLLVKVAAGAAAKTTRAIKDG